MGKEKLIRDKYETIINSANTYKEKDAVKQFVLLNNKVSEELNELRDTAFNDINEFADVIETLYSMAKLQGISIEDIETARLKKLEEKGSFDNFLVLKL